MSVSESVRVARVVGRDGEEFPEHSEGVGVRNSGLSRVDAIDIATSKIIIKSQRTLLLKLPPRSCGTWDWRRWNG